MTGDGIDPTLMAELIELDPAGGVALVRELIGLFFAEAPARVDLMRCGLAEGDPTRVAQAAHAMKGGANNLGAVAVGLLCSRIESGARRAELAGLAPVVDAIEIALASLGPALERRLAAIAIAAGVQ